MNKKQIIALAILTITALSAFQQVDNVAAEETFPDPIIIKDINIHGLVLDEYGQMVPGTTVSITMDGNVYSAITDVNGNYALATIPQVELPKTVTVQASRVGYTSFGSSFELTSDDNSIIDIELARGLFDQDRIFAGTIKDYLTGLPLVGASVTITRYSHIEGMEGNIPVIYQEVEIVGQATTSANGYYFFNTGIYADDVSFATHRITISKSGYPEYDEYTSFNYPYYALTNVKIIDLSYFILRGQVNGTNSDGFQEALSGAIIEVTSGSGVSLVKTTSDPEGNFLLHCIAAPSSSYTVTVSGAAYHTEEAIIPASAGIHEVYPVLEYIPLEEQEENWFSSLFSVIKEKAWQALDEFLTNEDNIGANKTFQKDFDIKNVAEASLDLNLIYSAPYEVTIEIVAEPFENRPGTYIGVNIPIPVIGEFVEGRLRFGGTVRLIDQDHDLRTIDPVLVLDQLVIGKAVCLSFDVDLMDLIEMAGIKAGNDADEMKEYVKELKKLSDKLDNFIELPTVEFAVGIEIGQLITVNGVPGYDATGNVIDSISFTPYLQIFLRAELSYTAKLKLYLTDWLKFKLASGELSLTVEFEFLFFPFEANYHFYENRLELNFLRVDIDRPEVHVDFDWSFLAFGGHVDIFDYVSDKPDIHTDWLFSTEFGGSTANKAAYEGIITDSNSNVISGATVAIYNIGGDYIKETTTDASGSYYINEVAPYSVGDFSIRVSKSGYVTSDFITVPAQRGLWEKNIVISPDAVSYFGVVYDNNNNPLAGATVTIKDTFGIPLTSVQTSNEPFHVGEFTTPYLPTSYYEYSIVITEPGYNTKTLFAPASRGNYDLGNIYLSRASVNYVGNVRDTSAVIMKSMLVQLKTTTGSVIDSTYTSIYGEYSLSADCIVDGNYQITFSKVGFITKNINVDADAGTRTYNVIVSHTKVRYYGYAKNNIGVKLAGARVRILRNGVEIGRDYADSNGYYVTPYVDTTVNGYYSLQFYMSGYSYSYRTVDADAGTRRYDRTLTASSSIRIYGYVKNEYGSRLAYARLEVYGNNILMKSYTASSTGYFSFYVEKGLISSYKVYARHDSFIDTYKTINSLYSASLTFYLYDYHGVVPIDWW